MKIQTLTITALLAALSLFPFAASASFGKNEGSRLGESETAPVTLHYDIYAGGFKALNAALTLRLDDAAYDISLEAATEGFIGKLFPWEGAYSTEGTVTEDALHPMVATSASSWRGEKKMTEMDYSPEGDLLKTVTRENGAFTEKRNAHAKRAKDALDMLTGALALMQAAGEKGACKGSFPVFDGKRRFNITLKDDGREQLPPSRYSSYEGMALRCIISVKPVAGFSKEDKKRGWLAVQSHTEARGRPPLLWLGKLKGAETLVPVKMQISSAYGAVVAHLDETE